MKIWYKAVCDDHKEYSDVVVSNTYFYLHQSQNYLGDREEGIVKWLNKHYGCKLKLLHMDEDLDFFHTNGYTEFNG